MLEGIKEFQQEERIKTQNRRNRAEEQKYNLPHANFGQCYRCDKYS